MFEEYVPDAAGERSRATMFDVIRAAEVHRYSVVLVENVVEVASWELFDWWLNGMGSLGYSHQIVCVSSAHIGSPTNPFAPQWRDRIYVVFTRDGVPAPDVEPRPLAWCEQCDRTVRAKQWWKRSDRRKIGKYGPQYLYRCPRFKCRHSIVEPFVLPAAAAIDWSDLGSRIGDRSKPLAPATMRRIQAGLEMFAQPTVVAAAGNTYEAGTYRRAWPAGESPLMARQGTACDGLALDPFMMSVNHDGEDPRAYPAHARPLPTRSAKIGDGLVSPFVLVNRTNNYNRSIDEPMPPMTTAGNVGVVNPEPFVTMLRQNDRPMGIDEPLATLAAAGRHHGLTVPPGAFYVKQFSSKGPGSEMCKSVEYPLGTITGRDHHSLVIPYRRGKAKTTGEPLLTMGTRDSAGLCSVEVDVEDCHFRMLKPREHLRAQRFHDDYVVTGNQGEQTMQAGNAVSANVAQWLGAAVMEALR